MNDLPGMLSCTNLMESVSQLVVVDNGSADQSVATATAAGAKVIQLQGNPGFGAAVNVGVANTDSELICIMNPDIRLIEADTLSRLARHFGDGQTAVAGPSLVLPGGFLQDSARYIPRPWELVLRRVSKRDFGVIHPVQASGVPWMVGAFLMIRRSAFERIGGFDERFHMYFEDVDLCVRLQQDGWNLIFDPAVQASHFHRAASRGSITSWSTRQHMRSAIKFYGRHPRHLVRRTVTFRPKPMLSGELSGLPSRHEHAKK